jgi:hypothetical protein
MKTDPDPSPPENAEILTILRKPVADEERPVSRNILYAGDLDDWDSVEVLKVGTVRYPFSSSDARVEVLLSLRSFIIIPTGPGAGRISLPVRADTQKV